MRHRTVPARGLPQLLALVAILLAAPLADDAAGQCVFTGLSSTSFGTGTGVCSSSTLQAALDPGACTLTFSFAADPFWCGNTYLTQHLLIVGTIPIPDGAGVGPPFIPGSLLYVFPLVILGPFPGAASQFTLPPNPALVGFPFQVQAAPTFVTTVQLPIVPEPGLSTALHLTLL